MIRFIVRTVVLLLANAVGLIVASLVLNGVALNFSGFILAVIIFTVVVGLMTPFMAAQFRRRNSSAIGGVALIATLISLIVTDLVSSGLEISGIGNWLLAAVIVWAAALLAAFILPFLGLKKYMEEKRSD